MPRVHESVPELTRRVHLRFRSTSGKSLSAMIRGDTTFLTKDYATLDEAYGERTPRASVWLPPKALPVLTALRSQASSMSSLPASSLRLLRSVVCVARKCVVLSTSAVQVGCGLLHS